MEDPFFVVKEEVQRALNNVNKLHLRWRDLLDSKAVGKEEFTWTTNEIKNNIRSIEWDLEDLTETVSIVESNPTKFHLTLNDIEERKQFIKNTRSSTELIKQHLLSPETSATVEKGTRNALLFKHSGNKYEKLDNEIVQSNQRYINEQQQQQQVLMSQQDNQMEHVSHSVGVLKSMGQQIGNELEEQAIILDGLGHEIDQTDSKLQTVLVRVEKMLRLADDKKQTYVLIALVLMMVIVVVLFVAL